MATFTGRYAADNFPKASPGWANPIPLFGNITVSANPADGDIYELLRTPKNFLAMFGFFQMDDLDTGTEVLDLDLGWAANGGGTETFTTADGTIYTNAAGSAAPDGLLNMGALTGDVVTGVTTVAATWRPIPMGAGLFFSRPTMIQVEANVPANALTAGGMSVILFGSILG